MTTSEINLRKIFSYFKWITSFNINGINYGGTANLVMDDRLIKFNNCYSVNGKRVLELGPFEAAHTLTLTRLGAKEVLAVEGQVENFIKCSIIKYLFDLNNCHFILEDVMKTDFKQLGNFDVCLCSGILYHLTDPYSVLKSISQVTDNIFIWTQIAKKECPKGRAVDYRGYRGKYFSENSGGVLSGLEDKSIWLFTEDFLRMLKDVGFTEYKMLAEGTNERKHERISSWIRPKASWILVYAFKGKQK